MAALAALLLGACGGSEEVGARAPAAEPIPAEGGEWRAAGSSDTIDLRRIGYARGPEDAPVAVYEFSDFGCPFCGMFARGTYPELHREYVATGRVRWAYVPLVMGFPGGEEGARAAECAGEQGRFWAMHDVLYEQQKEWKAERRRERLLPEYAQRAGLDAERFLACYREDRGGSRTALNNQVALLMGIRATPTFLVNGRLVEGALPAEQFRQLLDASLADR